MKLPDELQSMITSNPIVNVVNLIGAARQFARNRDFAEKAIAAQIVGKLVKAPYFPCGVVTNLDVDTYSEIVKVYVSKRIPRAPDPGMWLKIQDIEMLTDEEVAKFDEERPFWRNVEVKWREDRHLRR